jgi:pimeloyl-ACP methyl ester carboxylesterase
MEERDHLSLTLDARDASVSDDAQLTPARDELRASWQASGSRSLPPGGAIAGVLVHHRPVRRLPHWRPGRQNGFIAAVSAWSTPAHAGVDTWLTDSRGDLPKINVRTLLVRGDADRILPYEATAKRLRDLLRSTPLPGISTQSLQRARRSC